MTSYRNSKLIERYEDVVFELQSALNSAPANGQPQLKSGHRLVADNTGEETPFDWYHARFDIDFKINKLADGVNMAVGDFVATVNSAHSLIKKLNVKMNAIDVYDCDYANDAVNIKNLLEYSQDYSKSQATNEFFYLDQTTSAESRRAQPTFNSGFAARKALLQDGAVVNVEIPLNRYGFFESLHGELLPNSKVELTVELESDTKIVWRAAGVADFRVIVTKLNLIVPRIIFNNKGRDLYLSKYIDTRKWTYLRELVVPDNPTTQQTGSFRISTGINRPRHVFVYILNTPDADTQAINKFHYKTFSVSTNPRTLTSCHLEVGNGREYPEVHYRPSSEPARIFRDVLKYVHANSDYSGSTLINRANFNSIFPLIYFDLTKQPTDILDGMTRLVFKYTLSGVTAENYTIRAVVLYEQDVELRKTDGRLVLRSM